MTIRNDPNFRNIIYQKVIDYIENTIVCDCDILEYIDTLLDSNDYIGLKTDTDLYEFFDKNYPEIFEILNQYIDVFGFSKLENKDFYFSSPAIVKLVIHFCLEEIKFAYLREYKKNGFLFLKFL